MPLASAACPRCGRRPASACPKCGFACDPDFAFCPRCGEPRDADKEPAAVVSAVSADHEDDRRQVTVVFADLTGFTSLAEQLDPETVRAFQNALFESMAQVIQRYDGFVEKFVGDAVMAVFGAPRAHEDDPQRALEAAWDMLRRVEGLSLQWAERLGRPVTLHIGVHTGPVVAGRLGSADCAAYAVTGDTVNTAARLLAAATAGTVLVSQATQALVRHHFAFEPAAELALRGRIEPVRVHRLLGLRSDAVPARGLAELGLAAPLIGRGEALAHLMRAFERMQQGRAQVVCVVGEAGAGKSRLLDAFCTRLDGEAAFAATAVRRVSCSNLGEPTYGTFGALFREAYRVDAGDSLETARGKLQRGLLSLGADTDEADTVGHVLDVLLGIQEARPRDIEPAQLQRQITLAARALLERRLAHQPLLLIVDDLHWADAASVDLLHQLVDELADRRLMLLLLQRPDARVPTCRRAEHSRLELEPLGEDDTRTLLDHLLGAPADGGLAPVRELVVQRAGGNPLFVEEILRSLVAGGLLVRRHDRWACEARCDKAQVPPTLYGLLLSRVDRLAADDRRALQEAAVLGAEFDGTLLQQVASAPVSVAQALHRLAAADLVRADAAGGVRWRFAHGLLHEVVYQNLLLARRTEMHERVGRALEAASEADSCVASGSHPPQRLAELEALGHHWSLSPDKLRGARYLSAAGDWAGAVYANDDAMRHYERALRTLAEAAPGVGAAAAELEATRLAVRERLADLLGLQGRRAEALAHYEAVLDAVPAPGQGASAARLLRKIGGLHWEAGDRERASACFDGGLERLGEDGDAIERAYLFQEMGRLAFRAGDNSAALALAERALAELPAEAADGGRAIDPAAPGPVRFDAAGERVREAAIVRAQVCNTLGVALARLGRPVDAVTQIERSVRQAEAGDLPQAACRGYTNLGVLYASLDPQRSIETCLLGLATAKKVGDLGFQSRLYANLAVAYCALTNRCEAEGIEAARTAAQLDRRLGLLDHLAVPLIVLGQIHQCHGDHVRAFASYEEALTLAEQVDDPQLLFPCYDGLATLHLDAGNPVQAERYLTLARTVCDRAGLEPDALMVLPFLC